MPSFSDLSFTAGHPSADNRCRAPPAPGAGRGRAGSRRPRPGSTRRLPISTSNPGTESTSSFELGHPYIPRPRSPLAESLRRILPRPEPPTDIDIEEACTDLVEVAVRTSSDGSWQEHACFLLGSSAGRWHMVPFSHPTVSELLPRLRALPGFDDDALLDVIGSRQAEIVVLWRDPARAPVD